MCIFINTRNFGKMNLTLDPVCFGKQSYAITEGKASNFREMDNTVFQHRNSINV